MAAIHLYMKMVLDGMEGFIADDVLNFAGIFCGNLTADTKAGEKTGKDGMTLEDLLCHIVAFISQRKETVTVYGKITALLQQADGSADAGFGVAHVLSHINAANVGTFLGEQVNGFQVHFGGFL